jgi:hypothetical protein
MRTTMQNSFRLTAAAGAAGAAGLAVTSAAAHTGSSAPLWLVAIPLLLLLTAVVPVAPTIGIGLVLASFAISNVVVVPAL